MPIVRIEGVPADYGQAHLAETKKMDFATLNDGLIF